MRASRLQLLTWLLFMATTAFAQPTAWGHTEHQGRPWVDNISRPYDISMGLQGRHLALWASHGYYYDHNTMQWQWQRPALYTTCEDLFTQTIVVPYLIPMLENAGAIVFTPRERDWQRHEVIVDNDQTTSLVSYREHNYRHGWTNAPRLGFAFHAGSYHDGENPFTAGTARMVKSTKSKTKQSMAIYQPDIPEEGRYAVYVSYQTLTGSIDDAHYTVYHKGQKTEFKVNQQMGGSTWVYLGTFDFDKGCNPYNCVTLTNQSQQSGGIVTTDAVRFGGGMGNIERGGITSGLPRCLEGARYAAQWAGMPYSVYSPRNGDNDYSDDIQSRSRMLNELCGRSVFAPDSAGRGVPIELSLAIHSDAGYNKPFGEGIYGTLGICTTGHGDSFLAAGHSRQMSKELAQQLVSNVNKDLRNAYGTWMQRDIYDRNYAETRMPIVPSAILETLSHQSFTDMRFGLDPNFRFTLARSIYKTLLRYINQKHNTDYVVSPLTPHDFRIEFTENGKGEVLLSWTPTTDAHEPSANATGYLLYTAENYGDFDNGTFMRGTSATLRLQPGKLYHFRVAALNKGGQSFPSLTLSACFQDKKAPTILIVDGFHRLASPAVTQQGFDIDEDPGVSLGRTCGILGRQRCFDLNKIGVVDSTGLGFTTSELAGQFIAGNEQNHVRTHADAIYAGHAHNIISCSSEAIELMPLYRYDLVDLILGLERNDGYSLNTCKTFTDKMQGALSQYTAQGGRLLVSGAYIASDMVQPDEQRFLSQVLKCLPAGTTKEPTGTVTGLGTSFQFYRHLNEQHYAATRTDVLAPMEGAFSAMAYADGNPAATAYRGTDFGVFAMGFPFECIQQANTRASIMQGILNYLLK